MSSRDKGSRSRGTGRAGSTQSRRTTIPTSRETTSVMPPVGQHVSTSDIPRSSSADDVGRSPSSVTRPSGHGFSRFHHGEGPSAPHPDAQSDSIDRRLFIFPTDDNDFGPLDNNRDAVKKIGCIIKERNNSSASTYTELEPHLKELWWNEFKRCFRWNFADEGAIKKIYKRRVSRAFSYKLFNVRKTEKRPGYMNQDVYDSLTEYWDTEEYKEKCQKAKENRASDSGGSISHFSGAKPRSMVEKKLRDELQRQPRLDETFFAQYAKTNAEGQIEWANQKAEKAYNDYLGNLPGEASNSEGGEPPSPSPDIQLQTWAQTQGVSKKGTVYGLAGRASCVRPTRSTQNSYTQGTNYTAAPPDEQTIGRLNDVENKLASVLDSMEIMRAQHRAELEMQRMMYVQMLSAAFHEPWSF